VGRRAPRLAAMRDRRGRARSALLFDGAGAPEAFRRIAPRRGRAGRRVVPRPTDRNASRRYGGTARFEDRPFKCRYRKSPKLPGVPRAMFEACSVQPPVDLPFYPPLWGPDRARCGNGSAPNATAIPPATREGASGPHGLGRRVGCACCTRARPSPPVPAIKTPLDGAPAAERDGQRMMWHCGGNMGIKSE
jgi:hypothetical protein